VKLCCNRLFGNVRKGPLYPYWAMDSIPDNACNYVITMAILMACPLAKQPLRLLNIVSATQLVCCIWHRL